MGWMKVFVLGALLGSSLLATACSTPSQKYGLPPPSETKEAYPNINADPAKKSADPTMTPAQRAAAEAELEKKAGVKTKTAQ